MALLAAIAVSVALPFAVNRVSTDSALQARDWVAETSRVKATVYHLTFLLRDMEAATYSILQGSREKALQQRIATDRTRIPQLITHLRVLMHDNVSQRKRMADFSAVVEGRMALMQRAQSHYAAGDVNGAYQALGDAIKIFHYSGLADRIVAEESHLLTQRTRLADRKTHRLYWMTGLTALAQLVLLGIVVVMSERQVQQRWLAERRTRRAVERAQLVMQSIREPIAVLDGQLNAIALNAAFSELYDAGDDGRSGMPLRTIGDGAWTNAALLRRLQDVAGRGRELWDYDLSQTTSDGVERQVLINARPLELPDRDGTAVLLTVSDVSALKVAEAQVNELNRQLEGKIEQVSDVNRELKAFSYSVSHDLRAPLRHVAGFSGKLARHLGERADDKTLHYIDVIIDASRRMSELIDDLLVYSRLGRGALRLRQVDMQSLVDEARTVTASDIGDRQIEWRVEDLPVVVGDENMLRTVWQNLIGNAVKYTGKREHAVIEVTGTRNARGHHVFTVRDNGAGFDMRFIDKLFGVFQRLHKASEFAGTGIGLASVRRIISRHGGRVWAEGELDKGASFSFSIPETTIPEAAEADEGSTRTEA